MQQDFELQQTFLIHGDGHNLPTVKCRIVEARRKSQTAINFANRSTKQKLLLRHWKV